MYLKIDRLYNWKGDSKRNVELVLQEQGQNTRNEFEKRCSDIIVQFAEQVKKRLFFEGEENKKIIFSFSLGS